MPYIKIDDRMRFDEILVFLQNSGPQNAGELNYLITKIVHLYMEGRECYQNYNDVIGALEGCKLELYRRRIGPYEDIKIKQNGDV